VSLADIDTVEDRGSRVDALTMQRPRAARARDRRRHRHDTPATPRWRRHRRKRTPRAKHPFRVCAATSECANAIARNRGFDKLRVRGRAKAKAILLWYALAHNAIRALSLRAALA
jgi:hypothetical protein